MSNTPTLFQQYTPYDTEIVKTATRYDLYLIGGTAVDLLCRYYSIPFWRNRSDNDLDFWTSSANKERNRFVKQVGRKFGISVENSSDYMVSLELEKVKIEADILIDYDCTNTKFTSSIDGICVMSPIYLFSSKFDRYINTANIQRKKTDFYDLRTLLSIIEKTNGFDELESHLSNRDYDQRAEDMLNDIIASML
ncbi:hypothetical protein [Odoribacter laneus]|mgnify:FL=1|uniref:Uncharacterized protein n=1 Tax=Odoribacter laneus YIT 12061 TaxID=742817 RepID=H1DD60_9BACT|nr:hypothetical protein [Odoribacter laneus]EHP51036.1 hypothetical protein HMPREF9449_00038 [Odoribacter laneus YIT 12061]